MALLFHILYKLKNSSTPSNNIWEDYRETNEMQQSAAQTTSGRNKPF